MAVSYGTTAFAFLIDILYRAAISLMVTCNAEMAKRTSRGVLIVFRIGAFLSSLLISSSQVLAAISIDLVLENPVAICLFIGVWRV